MSKKMSRYPTDRKVYVGELGSNARKDDIVYAFSAYGTLRSVWVARNPPGFAFVEFEDARDAADAVRGLDGRTVCGRKARVELSTGRFAGGRRGGGDRSRNGRSYGSDDKLKCYDCGGKGHYARECRRNARRRRSTSRSRSRSVSRGRRTRSRSRSRTRSRSTSATKDLRKSRDTYGTSKSRENGRGGENGESSRYSDDDHNTGADSPPPKRRYDDSSPSPRRSSHSKQGRSTSRKHGGGGGGGGSSISRSRSSSRKD